MEPTIVLSVLTVVIVALVIYKDKKEKDILLSNYNNLILTIDRMFVALNNSITKFHESVEKMQIEHFKNLEKHSARQLTTLEKTQKDFLKELQSVHEINVLGIPKEPPHKLGYIAPSINPLPVENPIEKEEIPEIPLTEDFRIPIVEGVKFKFEGEEEIINA